MAGLLDEQQMEAAIAAEDTSDTDTDVQPDDESVDYDLPGQARPTPTYKVKVDGQELDVPVDELVNGYQRQADYTRKTQALSKEKQEIEALSAVLDLVNGDEQLQKIIKDKYYRKTLGVPYNPKTEAEVAIKRENNYYKSENLINRFVSIHPDMDEQQLGHVVNAMAQTFKQAGYMPDPEMVYRTIRYDDLARENETLKSGQKQSARNRVPHIQQGNRQSPAPKSRKVTMDNARYAALQFLRKADSD